MWAEHLEPNIEAGITISYVVIMYQNNLFFEISTGDF